VSLQSIALIVTVNVAFCALSMLLVSDSSPYTLFMCVKRFVICDLVCGEGLSSLWWFYWTWNFGVEVELLGIFVHARCGGLRFSSVASFALDPSRSYLVAFTCLKDVIRL
jgi:hypothetical protein